MIERIAGGVALAVLAAACARGGPAWTPEPVAFQVRGVVVQAHTQQPEAAVLLRMEEVNASTHTDAEGRFILRAQARPGRYEMTAARIGLAPRRLRIRIPATGTVDVGRVVMRPRPIELHHLVVQTCRAPEDTAAATSVGIDTDPAGNFWPCVPPRQ